MYTFISSINGAMVNKEKKRHTAEKLIGSSLLGSPKWNICTNVLVEKQKHGSLRLLTNSKITFYWMFCMHAIHTRTHTLTNTQHVSMSSELSVNSGFRSAGSESPLDHLSRENWANDRMPLSNVFFWKMGTLRLLGWLKTKRYMKCMLLRFCAYKCLISIKHFKIYIYNEFIL